MYWRILLATLYFGKLKTTKLSSLDSYRILTLNFRIKKNQNKTSQTDDRLQE